MDAWCPFSGVSYKLEHFGNKTQIICPHPIFRAPLKLLVSQAGKWAAGKLDENERRLLFLSLLHNTGHVEFKATAEPTDRIVQQNMEKLLRFINWESNVANPQLAMPRFIIRGETRFLEHVRHWIDSWWDVKTNWELGSKITSQRKRLAQKEAALDRLIHSATLNTEDYAGRLADWAFEASGTPAEKREAWKTLFRLKGFNIIQVSSDDLDELLEYMEHNLLHYNAPTLSGVVLKHIRTLVAKNHAGIEWWLGGGSNDDILGTSEKTSFTIIDLTGAAVPIEDYNKQVAIDSYAPADGQEPQRHNYPNSVAYMRARAGWLLQQNAVKEATSPSEPSTQQTLDL